MNHASYEKKDEIPPRKMQRRKDDIIPPMQMLMLMKTQQFVQNFIWCPIQFTMYHMKNVQKIFVKSHS
jgi:hypothetical protein